MSALAYDPEDDGAFSVDWQLSDGYATLKLTGELDIGAASCLSDALANACDHGLRTIVLELSGLTFIDSSGLHELVKALKRQRQAGGDVVLHAPTAQTMRVLEIVGLSKVFTITS